MWVAPEARGDRRRRGALVDAVVAWAAASGARALRTAVTIGNERRGAPLRARRVPSTPAEREPLGHSDAETALLERALAPVARPVPPVRSRRWAPCAHSRCCTPQEVERVAAFYAALGLRRARSACPVPTARPGTSACGADGAELAVVTEDSPRDARGGRARARARGTSCSSTSRTSTRRPRRVEGAGGSGPRSRRRTCRGASGSASSPTPRATSCRSRAPRSAATADAHAARRSDDRSPTAPLRPPGSSPAACRPGQIPVKYRKPCAPRRSTAARVTRNVTPWTAAARDDLRPAPPRSSASAAPPCRRCPRRR